MESIFRIIAGAGFIQGLFMAAALASRKRGRRQADLALAVLMLAFSANILHAGFLRDWRSFGGVNPVPDSYEPFVLFFGPLSYLYVRLVSGASERARRLGASDLLHFIPAIVLVVGLPPLSHLLPASGLRALDVGFWACSVLYLLAYVLATSRDVRAHRRRLREEYSTIEAADLGWVRAIMVALLSVELLCLVLLVWMVHGDPFPHFGKLLALAATILAYGLGYRGLTRRVPEGAPDSRAPKYARSSLRPGESSELEAELLRCMIEDKPWMDPEFSLQSLADRLGRSRNQLSQVINVSFGMNFYEFANGYRVREVQRLLSSPGSEKYKMLALAMDAGFASKNTFNAAFKKVAGLTPSQYRSGLDAGIRRE
jgi:AraC-like DNA-binding protein